MITAVYSHRQPSNAMLDIIKQHTLEGRIISNIHLNTKHTRYLFKEPKKQQAKRGGQIWGGNSAPATNDVHHIVDTQDYPFNWMLDIAKPSALISELSRHSDRMLVMFPNNADIPPIYIMLAMTFNKQVKVYRGNQLMKFEPNDIMTPLTRKQYDSLILPTIEPIPKPSELMTTPNGATLRPYQQQIVNFGLEKPFTGWFVDMGLGKTLAALALIDEWIKREEIDVTKPILVVAPIMVALDTWGREVEKWGYDWDTIINIRKTPKQRDEILRSLLMPMDKPTLFLTNPHQLEPIRQYYFSRSIPLPFEVLVVDELSMFKSPQAKRNETIAYYREGAEKFLGLTGTPSPNNLLDVWNQVKLINRNDSDWAGHNIYTFQDKYFIPVIRTPQGHVRKWKPKVGAEDVIYRHLSKDVISMRTEGLVELPEISYTNMRVELPPKARREYDTLTGDIKEELEAGDMVMHQTDNGTEVMIPNSDVLQSKLSQIAGGALYASTDEVDLADEANRVDAFTARPYTVIHDEKLEALNDIIESATSPMLVFYYYRVDYDRIQKHFKGKLPELNSKDPNVQSVIQKWNDGDIPVLLAHPASVGHGLNLQDGGHTAVWFSLPNWNNDYYQQANKRLHRSGQKNPVTITHIIAKDTIDEVMLRSIQSKEQVNSNLMDALDTMERG